MSSFLDRLRSRMTGSLNKPLFTRPKPAEKSRRSVSTNRWDEKVWDDVRKTEVIDNFITDLSLGDEHKGGQRAGFEAAPELAHDLFMSFYKASPQLFDKRDMAREAYPVHKIITEMTENPRLQELQEITASDPAMTTVALQAVGDTVREIIGRIPPPPPPPQPKPPKQKKEKKEGGQPGEGDPNPGDKPLDGEGEGGHPGDGEGDGDGSEQEGQGGSPGAGEGDGEEQDEDLTDEEGDDEFDPDSEEAEDQAESDWQDAYDDLLDDLDLERAMHKALEAADQEASDLDNLRKGIGLEDGEWSSMSPEARLAMAERLRTPEMKALAEAIGRMKRFALGIKANRVTDVPHEAFDVENGNDLKRILRSEFALLSTKETSYEFYRKYSDRELLQFKMRGREEVGKGPIVIAIDKSGSMGGQPFTWALAVAEALRRFADEEDRDYYAMFFGNNNDRERFDFPKGKGPFEKVMSFLSVDANGGTQFDGVLTEALEKASKSFDGEGKGKADIVFITDGMARLDETWIKGFNEERERVGVRVYSVYIGGAYDTRNKSGPLGLLESISDAAIPVSELKPESAKAIFAKV